MLRTWQIVAINLKWIKQEETETNIIWIKNTWCDKWKFHWWNKGGRGCTPSRPILFSISCYYSENVVKIQDFDPVSHNPKPGSTTGFTRYQKKSCFCETMWAGEVMVWNNGRSKISHWEHERQIYECQPIIWLIFPKTARKWKKLDRAGPLIWRIS